MNGTKSQKRKILFHSPRYQSQLTIMIMMPSFLICLLMSIMFYFLLDSMLQSVISSLGPAVSEQLAQAILASFYILWGLFVVLMLGAVFYSNRLIGGAERVLRELDHVLETKKKQVIKVRPRDTFMAAVAERFNKLMDYMPE